MIDWQSKGIDLSRFSGRTSGCICLPTGIALVSAGSCIRAAPSAGCKQHRHHNAYQDC